MSDNAARLAEDRANRVAARALFDADRAQVQADLAARGIGGRIADTAVGKAKEAGAEALEIAQDNKGVVAGTFAALLLWTFRNPLIAAVRRIVSKEPDA